MLLSFRSPEEAMTIFAMSVFDATVIYGVDCRWGIMGQRLKRLD